MKEFLFNYKYCTHLKNNKKMEKIKKKNTFLNKKTPDDCIIRRKNNK